MPWSFENNPYQFIPFDVSCLKLRGPARSLSKFEGISGHLVCTLKTHTPLFIGGKRYENSSLQKIDFFEIDGKPAIPGASIRGMIRSVIEAATGSCFSVFDESPLHFRNLNAFKAAGEIIEPPSNGRPGKIRRMQRGWIAMNSSGTTVRVRQNGSLSNFTLAMIPAGINSGDTIWIKYKTINCYQNSRGRSINAKFHLITDVSPINKSGYTKGIYKITGESIRHPRTGSSLKKRERVFFPSSSNEVYEFNKNEYNKYNSILKDQLDTWESRGRAFDFFEQNDLEIGSLVYFEPIATNKIARKISRVEIPRIYYDTSRGDILNKMKLQKCDDPNNLCPACSLFGFIEDTKSLRSRVRIEDAEHKDGSGPVVGYWKIKLLGTPHPSSCNLYLIDPENPDIVRNYDGIKFNNSGNLEKESDRQGRPTPNWKSDVELRGRKMYFHHPNMEKSKYLHPTSDQPEMRCQVKPVLKDNTFEFRIHFSNLTEAELGLLIWGLELEGNLCHKLGMGKPIGFGSVSIEITDVHLEDLIKSKYQQWDESISVIVWNNEEYMTSFHAWFKQKTGKDFDKTMSYFALEELLNLDEAKYKELCYPEHQGFEAYRQLKGTPLPKI